MCDIWGSFGGVKLMFVYCGGGFGGIVMRMFVCDVCGGYGGIVKRISV